MKFSSHTILVNDYPAPGECLAFNTRTQALVKINRELKETVDHDGAPSYFSRRVRYSEDLSRLHEMGVIAADEGEDRRNLESFFRRLKTGVKKSNFPVTVLTTYACNFKCVYCFQESSRVNARMDAATAGRVMRWIKKRLERFGYEQLYVVFYGGEPLVNKPVLEKIAGHMKGWCERRGIRFKFMLQTNGYLMTPECIDRYLKLGLDQVRISVDGVGEEHDRNRPLRNGGGTFDRIMDNIAACADKVTIGISTSYDRGDVGKIERLLDYFDERELLHKLGRFIFSPVHAALGPAGCPEQILGADCMGNYEDENLLAAARAIRGMMERRGLPVSGGMSIAACPLTRENAGVTIDQDGRIYKCNSMLGHPEFSVGDVRDDEYNEKDGEFVHLDVWRRCPRDCPYLPMCGGGCRLSSFLKHRNFTAPACHKAYLDKMAPEFIKQEYEASRRQ